ncbi:MAG: glycosyl hydrolase, partial [Gemmatimonadetes bacterium]|nr:glycosyl hydrolase [Gemmatimonadota bacterium]
MPRDSRERSVKALLALTLLAVISSPASVLSQSTAAGSGPGVDPAFFQELSWRHLGPFRGGRSVAAVGVTSDPLTYYHGGVGSGVWKTNDGGQTWENISGDSFGTSSVGAIAVSESDPNVVYVGMGEHAVRGVMTSHGDGVYRSTDAGRTWSHLGLENTRHISRIRVHPSDPDMVYVAAQGAAYGASEDRGIYRSLDGGQSWTKVLYAGTTASAAELAMDPTNPRILYAAFWDHVRYPWYVRSGGEGSGIWKSKDGGDTWISIHDGLPERLGKTAVDVSPTDPERVWAMVEADPGGGLYRSDDSGESWRLVSEDWALRARPWYYNEVFADPQDENTVYVLSAPMMKSVDGGETFVPVRTPHGDNHDLWINPTDNQVMINANDGGANVSFNGGESWSTQQNQPTVQFYRVNTDNRFPYYVYGGQQDNSSVAIASWAAGGIDWKDWYPVGGCESAIPGFDRDDPRYVYAGCYMGLMSEYDQETGASRNTQAYPVMPAALQASEMKYRFNWSAPIVVSQFDPNTIYHAANVLLRSRDRGRTWEAVSPDLTRAQKEKMGYGGGPITNEGAGGEIYGTLAYVAESPLQEGLIWTGSDDGLVHVTRDGGATWNDVTPEGLPEGLVNAVDPSPHDPGKAYIAFSRYKFDDFTPYAYKTEDFGQTWAPIAGGFGSEHWVRVVREDPVRPGLLYAGTEAGVYVSFDDGGEWQRLQLDLPLTPVTDLQIQKGRNDLVASTSGWGFWVLDDLSVLQQLDAVTGRSTHLFQNRHAYRAAGLGGRGGEGSTGENPPNGAIIDLYLETLPEGVVALTIHGDGGEVVRTYSTQPDEDGGEEALAVREGMNRVVWNLRHPDVFRVPDLYAFGSLQGRRVTPGAYTARLRVAPPDSPEQVETEATATITVLKDPRLGTPQSAFQEQELLLREIVAETEALHRAVGTLGEVRDQIESILDRAAKLEGTEEVRELGAALADSLTMVEDSLVQWKTYDGQTVLNAPSRLNFQYIYLMGAVEGSDEGVNEGARDVLRDLNARWHPLQARLDLLLTQGVDSFNQSVLRGG